MSRYAVIDLGSNTIRLCVYHVEHACEDPFTKKSFSIILDLKEMAGMSAYVHDGALSQKGIKRASRIVKEQLMIASALKCDKTAVFATAVLRNCSNSKRAQRAIERSCGTPVTILSNEDEAHLGLVGARLDRSFAHATLVDIGGGSTELTAISRKVERAKTSIPLGSLSSFTQFVSGLLPTTSEMDAIAHCFDEYYDREDQRAFRKKNLIGIGGAIRAATKVHGDLFCDGKRSTVLLPEQLEEMLDAYRAAPGHFMHQTARIIPDRIHTFIPGCIVISCVFSRTGAKKLTLAKHGIREGFLLERILGAITS